MKINVKVRGRTLNTIRGGGKGGWYNFCAKIRRGANYIEHKIQMG